MQNKWKTHS